MLLIQLNSQPAFTVVLSLASSTHEIKQCLLNNLFAADNAASGEAKLQSLMYMCQQSFQINVFAPGDLEIAKLVFCSVSLVL